MQHAVHFQVIQPGKDALLADAQAACDDTLFEIGVGLKRGFKQPTDKTNLFILNPRQIGVIQRYIVLVDEDDGIASVISSYARGEKANRIGIQAVIVCNR